MVARLRVQDFAGWQFHFFCPITDLKHRQFRASGFTYFKDPAPLYTFLFAWAGIV
jgi:hypothetical protein